MDNKWYYLDKNFGINTYFESIESCLEFLKEERIGFKYSMNIKTISERDNKLELDIKYGKYIYTCEISMIMKDGKVNIIGKIKESLATKLMLGVFFVVGTLVALIWSGLEISSCVSEGVDLSYCMNAVYVIVLKCFFIPIFSFSTLKLSISIIFGSVLNFFQAFKVTK